MPQQKHFFVTPKDLILALERTELSVPVQYVNAFLSELPQGERFESLLNWPNLGTCQHSNPTGGGFFLVMAQGSTIKIDTVQMNDLTIRYKPKIAQNPSAIIFEPGGVFRTSEEYSIFVVGKIATTNIDSVESKELFKSFSSKFLKGFKRAADAYCGPEAFESIVNGAKVSW